MLLILGTVSLNYLIQFFFSRINFTLFLYYSLFHRHPHYVYQRASSANRLSEIKFNNLLWINQIGKFECYCKEKFHESKRKCIQMIHFSADSIKLHDLQYRLWQVDLCLWGHLWIIFRDLSFECCNGPFNERAILFLPRDRDSRLYRLLQGDQRRILDGEMRHLLWFLTFFNSQYHLLLHSNFYLGIHTYILRFLFGPAIGSYLKWRCKFNNLIQSLLNSKVRFTLLFIFMFNIIIFIYFFYFIFGCFYYKN